MLIEQLLLHVKHSIMVHGEEWLQVKEVVYWVTLQTY
jgi:hypothetical protein